LPTPVFRIFSGCLIAPPARACYQPPYLPEVIPMTAYRKVQSEKILMGRLQRGDDLLETLTTICREENITLSRIQGLGAVEQARIGFYDQTEREYCFLTLDRPLEITALTGNVSLKYGDIFLHLHATLCDENGNAFGKHLAPGTTVFALKCTIEAFDGPPLNRSFDNRPCPLEHSASIIDK